MSRDLYVKQFNTTMVKMSGTASCDVRISCERRALVALSPLEEVGPGQTGREVEESRSVQIRLEVVSLFISRLAVQRLNNMQAPLSGGQRHDILQRPQRLRQPMLTVTPALGPGYDSASSSPRFPEAVRSPHWGVGVWGNTIAAWAATPLMLAPGCTWLPRILSFYM